MKIKRVDEYSHKSVCFRTNISSSSSVRTRDNFNSVPVLFKGDILWWLISVLGSRRWAAVFYCRLCKDSWIVKDTLSHSRNCYLLRVIGFPSIPFYDFGRFARFDWTTTSSSLYTYPFSSKRRSSSVHKGGGRYRIEMYLSTPTNDDNAIQQKRKE